MRNTICFLIGAYFLLHNNLSAQTKVFFDKGHRIEQYAAKKWCAKMDGRGYYSRQ